MKCPFCGFTEDKVIDSRPTEESNAIRRRRECLRCQGRYTTYETIENLPLIVIKKDGTRQTFDRNKVINCVLKACGKRPVSMAQAEQLAIDVETQIQNSMKKEVYSCEIGEMIMEKLKVIDEVSYVRFASVYKQFKDMDTFMDEISRLINENKKE